jgi:hypothetical protein
MSQKLGLSTYSTSPYDSNDACALGAEVVNIRNFMHYQPLSAEALSCAIMGTSQE